jgi:ElaB/YqjD/DUF883 family membrane-anchored ribosome-binding protein
MTYSMTDSDVKAAASRVGADVSRAVGDASERVGETVAGVRHAAAESFDKVETAIRRNPLAAASIAGGIGFLLAVLARR